MPLRDLTGVLTAEQLVAWKTGLDQLEAQDRRSDREAGIDRTAEQRRADLFAALPALVLAARATDAVRREEWNRHVLEFLAR